MTAHAIWVTRWLSMATSAENSDSQNYAESQIESQSFTRWVNCVNERQDSPKLFQLKSCPNMSLVHKWIKLSSVRIYLADAVHCSARESLEINTSVSISSEQELEKNYIMLLSMSKFLPVEKLTQFWQSGSTQQRKFVQVWKVCRVTCFQSPNSKLVKTKTTKFLCFFLGQLYLWLQDFEWKDFS